ncbi:lycopene cyclase domain-containing protein [Gephyromycinifex aptenodytis]|uniref:lycopene cyclase domain-containing protein n=1 Tax=Gephyromycinifex aptenodytis TaxID=2716227 RepID=UPI0014454B59|nr:lycopene cyclase domain-containing protein [Gephyromycinifex aptenodytis]
MSYTYLAALTVSILGMGLIDHRWRLALFRDAGAAFIVLAAGVALFLGWDHVGLRLGLFFRADGPYMTGLQLAPDLPVEESVFLLLLSYSALVLYTGALRLLSGRVRHHERAV